MKNILEEPTAPSTSQSCPWLPVFAPLLQPDPSRIGRELVVDRQVGQHPGRERYRWMVLKVKLN